MSEQAPKKEISLDEVSRSIEVVGILLSQLSIPASRAQEFALLGNTLGELKAFVDGQLAQAKQAAEGAAEGAVEVPAEAAAEAAAE